MFSVQLWSCCRLNTPVLCDAPCLKTPSACSCDFRPLTPIFLCFFPLRHHLPLPVLLSSAFPTLVSRPSSLKTVPSSCKVFRLRDLAYLTPWSLSFTDLLSLLRRPRWPFGSLRLDLERHFTLESEVFPRNCAYPSESTLKPNTFDYCYLLFFT